jgi:thiosulfate/3-mercaptopyruvate sulfurtransferase
MLALPRLLRGALAMWLLFAVCPPAAAAVGVPAPLVDTAWLKAQLGVPGIVILDIRSGASAAGEFADRHVPGAVHAPYDVGWRAVRDDVPGMLPEQAGIERHIAGLGVSNASTVVIVSAGTDATAFAAAARVYWTFKYLGHDDVAILDGGWHAWAEDPANPVTSGTGAPAAASFIASPRPGLLVSTMEVVGAIGGATLLVDARPVEEFTGAVRADAVDRAGHIPGSVNIDHARFYSAATNRLKPRHEIAGLVPADLVAGDAAIVSYCKDGQWAATNWFVFSELLGRANVRLYDASMIGWAKNRALPIATTLLP